MYCMLLPGLIGGEEEEERAKMSLQRNQAMSVQRWREGTMVAAEAGERPMAAFSRMSRLRGLWIFRAMMVPAEGM